MITRSGNINLSFALGSGAFQYVVQPRYRVHSESFSDFFLHILLSLEAVKADSDTQSKNGPNELVLEVHAWKVAGDRRVFSMECRVFR